MDYDELLNMWLMPDESQNKFMFTIIQSDDFHNFVYANFHAGLVRMMRDGYTIIKIIGESNFNCAFQKEDIDFINNQDNFEKLKNKPILSNYPETILKIKKMLYEDLKKIDNVPDLIFFFIMPYLDNKNCFYYNIILGVKKIDYNYLFKMHFSLLKNVNFISLTEQHLSYEFFKKFFNFDKNLFKNSDVRQDFRLFTNDTIKINDEFVLVKNLKVYYYYLKIDCYSRLNAIMYGDGLEFGIYFGDLMDWVIFKCKGEGYDNPENFGLYKEYCFDFCDIKFCNKN